MKLAVAVAVASLVMVAARLLRGRMVLMVALNRAELTSEMRSAACIASGARRPTTTAVASWSC